MAIPRQWSLFVVVLLALAGFAGADATGVSVRTTAREAPSTSSLLQGACKVADDEFFASRPIDSSSCGVEGSGDDAHRLQNEVKNNFCAGGFLTSSPTVDPARVTQFSFRKLEEETVAIRKKLGISAGTVPDDRSLFQETVHTTSFGDEVGEGTLVRYVGFLLEGHFTGEEGVNCERKKQVNFDIHMASVEQKPSLNVSDAQAEALECSSVTAEIIPRQRPEEWDFLGRLRKTKKPGALKGALAKIKAHDLHRPLRLTGQLFFDASHRVCANGQRAGGQPARAPANPTMTACGLRSTCSWRRERRSSGRFTFFGRISYGSIGLPESKSSASPLRMSSQPQSLDID